MFVKDTLKEEVSVVVQLGGAVRRNLYPEKQMDTNIKLTADSGSLSLFHCGPNRSWFSLSYKKKKKNNKVKTEN